MILNSLINYFLFWNNLNSTSPLLFVLFWVVKLTILIEQGKAGREDFS